MLGNEVETLKIFILCDLEGVTGVVSFARQGHGASPLFAEARAHLMSDLNAAIEGAIDGGAAEVVVFDMHHGGLNIALDQLDPRAAAILGRPLFLPDGIGLDSSYSGMFLVGYHSMAGAGTVQSHTYGIRQARMFVNGAETGEIRMEAMIAGQKGVPILLVTGDEAGLAEAQQLLPGVEGAVVKVGVADEGALCFPPAVTHKRIREAAQRAMRRAAEIEPYVVSPPFDLRIDCKDESWADRLASFSGARRATPHVVRFVGADIERLWRSIDESLCNLS